MKSLILGVVVIGTLIAAGVGGTFAGFVDTEESKGNFVKAGILDLLVNGKNDPVGTKFAYVHRTPGVSTDKYIDLFSWSECDGAYAYMQFKNVQSVEAGAKLHVGVLYVYDDTAVLGDPIPDGYLVQVAPAPVGAGVASSEPELIAEEGVGEFGQVVIGAHDPNLNDDPDMPLWEENLLARQGLGPDYASGVSEHLGIVTEVCDDGAAGIGTSPGDGILDNADTGNGGDTADDGLIGPDEYAAHNWENIASLTGKLDTLSIKNKLGFMASQTYAWIHVTATLQQIEDVGCPNANVKYWPTNALQGDMATWDMLFELNTD